MGNEHQITVMSYNVYHGVDLEIFRVPGATDLPDLLNRVAAVYQGYQARNFPERAQALAAEIEAGQPALIGLQEAVLVRTGALFNPSPAGTIAFDYVHSNVRADSFTTNCQIPTPAFGPLTVLRGWASVDVWSRGTSFRLISTHLDGDCLPYTSAVQVAQAREILDDLTGANLPIVLLGDVNASPEDPAPSAYGELAGFGFIDAWSLAGEADGYTCCQADDLSNLTSLLDSRIDVVLLHGDVVVRTVSTTGDTPADRTPSGLWPSDHAGVTATLEIPAH